VTLDGIAFVLARVSHTFAKSGGYRCRLSGKLKDGADAGDGSGGAASATQAAGTPSAPYLAGSPPGGH